jgi:hypothetical protein
MQRKLTSMIRSGLVGILIGAAGLTATPASGQKIWNHGHGGIVYNSKQARDEHDARMAFLALRSLIYLTGDPVQEEKQQVNYICPSGGFRTLDELQRQERSFAFAFSPKDLNGDGEIDANEIRYSGEDRQPFYDDQIISFVGLLNSENKSQDSLIEITIADNKNGNKAIYKQGPLNANSYIVTFKKMAPGAYTAYWHFKGMALPGSGWDYLRNTIEVLHREPVVKKEKIQELKDLVSSEDSIEAISRESDEDSDLIIAQNEAVGRYAVRKKFVLNKQLSSDDKKVEVNSNNAGLNMYKNPSWGFYIVKPSQ